jgi:hypothetical protein
MVSFFKGGQGGFELSAAAQIIKIPLNSLSDNSLLVSYYYLRIVPAHV